MDINQEETSNIKKVAELILDDDEVCSQFIQMKEGKFYGIELIDIYSYIVKNKLVLNNEKRSYRLDFIITLYRFFDTEYYYQVDETQILNPEFEETIMKDVNFNEIPEEQALELYDSLNRNIRFDSEFLILGQNLQNQNLKSKYDKEISSVKINDRIVCRVWSDICAYLINKYHIGRAFVKKAGIHRYVEACIGNSIIIMEAVSRTRSAVDGSYLKDLARAKLKLKPAGFEILYSLDGTLLMNLPTYVNLSYYYVPYNDRNCPTKEEIDGLTSLIDETEETKQVIIDEKNESKIRKIIEDIVFLNRLLKNSNLEESTECIDYLRQVYENVFRNETRVCLLNKSFYRYIENDYSCEYVPILSVCVGKDSKEFNIGEDKEYIYLIFKEGTSQFRMIKKDELLRLIKIEKIKIILNLVKSEDIDSKLIRMGLPELTLDRLHELFSDEEDLDDNYVWPYK